LGVGRVGAVDLVGLDRVQSGGVEVRLQTVVILQLVRGGDTRGGDTRRGDTRGGDTRGGDTRGGDFRGGCLRGVALRRVVGERGAGAAQCERGGENAGHGRGGYLGQALLQSHLHLQCWRGTRRGSAMETDAC
jgi:hypothetical protein